MSAATPAEQATSVIDPHVLRVVEAHLPPGETNTAIGVDVLVGCGRGAATPDAAAACVPRLAVPSRLVVLVGAQAARVAELAGLTRNGMWEPLGCPPCPVEVVETEPDLSDALARAGFPAGPAVTRSRSITTRATKLLNVLGKHLGRRTKCGGEEWRSNNLQGLTSQQVERHLDGGDVVAPFLPRGAWPYVVLDLDRHGPLQEKHFDSTLKAVRERFPNSYFVTSSESGGVHCYVRLPRDVEYEEAAMLMRAYVTIEGIRFVSEANGALRAEAVEVPRFPTRLPFGVGSSRLNGTGPLESQIDSFIRFLGSRTAKDFDTARAKVLKHDPAFRRAGHADGRRRLEQVLMLKETASAVSKALPAAWLGVRLSPAVESVVVDGIPAYGTRRTWTERLMDELVTQVDPARADALMVAWLHQPNHRSVDLERDPERVIADTKRQLWTRYKKRGVPVRLWRRVEAVVRRTLRTARKRPNGRLCEVKNLSTIKDDEVLKTAFQILQGFIIKGVGTRRVGRPEFAQVVGKDLAADMEKILSYGFWLDHVPEEQALGAPRQKRLYRLGAGYWPPRPGETVLYRP